ncbi:MAG: hypothetical protein WDM90_16170 [Ferruginibacter sp.]
MIDETKDAASLVPPLGGQGVFPGQVHDLPGGGIVLSKLDDIINWARSNSLWPLTFATSCCGIEMMATASAKYDFSRFGFEVQEPLLVRQM